MVIIVVAQALVVLLLALAKDDRVDGLLRKFVSIFSKKHHLHSDLLKIVSKHDFMDLDEVIESLPYKKERYKVVYALDLLELRHHIRSTNIRIKDSIVKLYCPVNNNDQENMELST